MSILIRYLIRTHVGPFLFSFSLITGLLFLNTIAQRLDQLMGKGLPWTRCFRVSSGLHKVKDSTRWISSPQPGRIHRHRISGPGIRGL